MAQKSSSAKRAPGKAAQTSRKWSAAQALGPGIQPSTAVLATTVQLSNDINYDELVSMNNQQRYVAQLINCAGRA